MDKKCEARCAFDQGADRRAAQREDEITFPMTRDRPVRSFSGAFANHDLGRYEVLSTFASALPWDAKRATGTQACCQLAAQRASALHVQCLVDGFGANAHRFVVRKIMQEPSRDLLRAPRGCPP